MNFFLERGATQAYSLCADRAGDIGYQVRCLRHGMVEQKVCTAQNA